MDPGILRPVAFVGPGSAEAVRRLYRLQPRFLPLAVPPESDLRAVLAGLAPLGCLGAVLSGPAELEAPPLVGRRTHEAERAGAVDAVAVHRGGAEGTHALEGALGSALESAGFRAVGGHAVVLGSGPAAAAAIGLARLGLARLTVASGDRPTAERLARLAPLGVATTALAWSEGRLADALERADLIVHCGDEARLDPRLLAPYHTLLEAAAETNLAVALERAGGQVVPHAKVAAHRLAAQLEFVTGLRHDAASLG